MNFLDLVGKHLECPICLERLKEPKSLFCLHTFCKSCIERIVEERYQARITCPTCRYVTKVHSIQSLRANYIAESIVQLVNETEAKEQKRKQKIQKKTETFLENVYGRKTKKVTQRKHASQIHSSSFSQTASIDNFCFSKPSFASHINHADVILGIKSYTPPTLFRFIKNPEKMKSSDIEKIKAQFFKPPSECTKFDLSFEPIKIPKSKMSVCNFSEIAKSFAKNKINWFSGQPEKICSFEEFQPIKKYTDFICNKCRNNFKISDEIDKARLLILSIELDASVEELLSYFNELNLKTSELLDVQGELFQTSVSISDKVPKQLLLTSDPLITINKTFDLWKNSRDSGVGYSPDSSWESSSDQSLLTKESKISRKHVLSAKKKTKFRSNDHKPQTASSCSEVFDLLKKSDDSEVQYSPDENWLSISDKSPLRFTFAKEPAISRRHIVSAKRKTKFSSHGK